MSCLWDLPEIPEPLGDWNTLPTSIQATARELASRTLERLCGSRVGVCPVTIRPYGMSPADLHSVNFGWNNYGVVPVNWNGNWSNVCMVNWQRCEVPLPAPVGRVDEVKVDGAVLATTDYRIDNDRILVWTGTGDCPFPRNQDLSLADTEDGTMSITYVNAYLPQSAGLAACFVLAREYALALTGARCRLPSGVTSIVRQGVSMTLESDSFPGGKTGIPEVDAYIALWNPKGIAPPQVWSPDLPQHRRVGG